MTRDIGAVDVLYQPPRGTCASPAEALVEINNAGVAVAMISQCKRWSCERQYLCVDTRLEDVLRFLRESIRFAGLAGYNPFDVTESVREMEAARKLGFRGAYLHAASFDFRLGDARLYPLFAKSAELGQPAIVQVPLAEPDVTRSIEHICRDFTELSLAIVHPRPSAEMFALCGAFERLAYVVDTAALVWICRHQRRLVDDARVAERCLWGSNGAPLAQSVAESLQLDLPLETRELILRTNALRFFAAIPPSETPQTLSDIITSAER